MESLINFISFPLSFFVAIFVLHCGKKVNDKWIRRSYQLLGSWGFQI